jgi:hypothetical membrane protein
MVGLKLEDLKSWKQLSCLIALLGGLQFIILTFIAMFLYPDGYSFTDNYLSHLGTTITVESHSPNMTCRILFLLACVIAGASLIPFWIVMTTLFTESEITRYFSYFGSFIGLVSSPLLMGIGIFPGNTHYFEHAFSARYFFLLFAAAILIYSVAILLKKDYQNIYAFVGFGFSLLIVLFIFRFFTPINPLMQKIIAYGFILWSAFQITKIWRIIGS